MKKAILLCLYLSFTNLSFAGVIFEINNNEVLSADHKEILHFDTENITLQKDLYFAKEHKLEVKVEKNGAEITNVTFLKNKSLLKSNKVNMSIDPMLGYTPTFIKEADLPTQLFNKLIGATQWKSQCFNRAHIWSKEMFDFAKINSTKIFIFYTKKYRQEVGGKWWFHVAPMLESSGGQLVLDKEFYKEPVSRDTWISRFAADNKCRVSTNINEYYDQKNQETEFCNIIVTSMFYRSPQNLKDLADSSLERKKFLNSDLRASAKEIYWGWRSIYERLKVTE